MIDARQVPSNGERVLFGDNILYLHLNAALVHKGRISCEGLQDHREGPNQAMA